MIIFTYYFYVVYSSANFQDYQDLGRFLQIILVFLLPILSIAMSSPFFRSFQFFPSVLLWPIIPCSPRLQVALDRRLFLTSPHPYSIEWGFLRTLTIVLLGEHLKHF